MSFRGNSWRLLVAKKLPALENHFHPETIGFQYVYFLLQLQLNLQNKRDRSLLKATPQAGCHEITRLYAAVYISVLDSVIKQGIESNLHLHVLETC